MNWIFHWIIFLMMKLKWHKINFSLKYIMMTIQFDLHNSKEKQFYRKAHETFLLSSAIYCEIFILAYRWLGIFILLSHKRSIVPKLNSLAYSNIYSLVHSHHFMNHFKKYVILTIVKWIIKIVTEIAATCQSNK